MWRAISPRPTWTLSFRCRADSPNFPKCRGAISVAGASLRQVSFKHLKVGEIFTEKLACRLLICSLGRYHGGLGMNGTRSESWSLAARRQVRERVGVPMRDRVAFVALIGFATVMYALPGEWIAQLAPLRLALLTSGLAAAAMLVRRLFRAEPIVLDGVRGISLIALALLALISTTWAINPQAARFTSIELLKLVALYLTLVNVVNTAARFRAICLALMIASMVASIGVIQWFLNGSNLVEGFRARWLGVHADPNHMAMDLGMVVPLALSFVTRRTQRPLIRVLAAIAAILVVTAVVLSHSRGGFIGLCVALVLWIFLSNRRVHAGVVAVLLAIGLGLFAPKSFCQRTESVTSFHEDASSKGRVYAWQVISEVNLDKPLLGVGAGGFRYAWPLYAPPEAKRAYVAHNIFLDVLGELGLVSLVFFLLFVGGA